MKVLVILVALVTLAVALPRSHDDWYGTDDFWDDSLEKEELQADVKHEAARIDDDDAGSSGWGNFYYDSYHSEAALVEPVELSGQIKVDDELEYGRGYRMDTVTYLGYAHDIANDKTCCEECKKIDKDTEFFGLRTEAWPDYKVTGCECIKSKPGVLPLTQVLGVMSGKCGLWEYNGDGELGEGRLIIRGTRVLGGFNNISDASYCCETCMDLYPDTQMFEFFEGTKDCTCQKPEHNYVPTTMEQVNAIGICPHDYKGSGSDGNMGVATEDSGTVDGDYNFDLDNDFEDITKINFSPNNGQINVDDELEYGRGYRMDTVSFLGYTDYLPNDKICCEECKKINKDTELFYLRTETGPDYHITKCECMKSKPGVSPLTRVVGVMSGKCGLWEYNGEDKLGEDNVIVEGTSSLGLINNVSDASYCCETCIDKYPDTQLFVFNKEVKECFCYKPKNDDVPRTMELVFAIGTCHVDYKGSGSDENIGVATKESGSVYDDYNFDLDIDFEDIVKEIFSPNNGQIKVDDELEYGRGYKFDTVTYLGYADNIANDKTCCEECKMIDKDTEFFGLFNETYSDYHNKGCECLKSMPGVLPLTHAVGRMSGKCGLWEYNGDGELGKDRLIIYGTRDLGGIKNVSDASYCCKTCMDLYPDTQLFDFFEEEKLCSCQKPNNDDVPTTMEIVNAIGTCPHDYKGSGSDGNMDVATEDSVLEEDYVIFDGAELEQLEKELIKVEDYNYVPNPNASMIYEPMTREFMIQRIMNIFEAYFDTNPRDGNLTKEEFVTGVQSGAHMNLTWEELLKLIDENCDGAITDLEFRGVGDLSFKMMAMDKDRNFYITQEELGDDKLWKNLLDEDPDKDGMINIEEYSKFILTRRIENDHCSAAPSADPSQAADKSLDKLFDDDEDDLGDGLDEIVVTLYRVRVGGQKIYYKKNADGGMELI